MSSVFRVALALAATGLPFLAAQEAVDYASSIQPLFDRSCSGEGCHIGLTTSGVRLDDHGEALASRGLQYDAPVVLPFRSAESPLIEKVSSDSPRFGERMPFGGPFLEAAEIALLARWIDEGALSSPARPDPQRGDYDDNGVLDMTDVISALLYMFVGDIEPPRCDPLVDSNADGKQDISDPIHLLTYLYLGGEPPVDLSEEESEVCKGVNLPPRADPIGTVPGREGVAMEFWVRATDPNGDALRFIAELAPEGLEVGASGRVRWTPQTGQAGDHELRIRIEDSGEPPLFTLTTALLRVTEGNHPPSFEPLVTAYGREGVSLSVSCRALDVDGDRLRYTLVSGPPGSSVAGETGLFEWTPGPGEAGEYQVGVRVDDDAEPPASSEGTFTLIILAADAPLNQPPQIPPHGVYRSYPGLPIALPIGASDPDGHELRYEAPDLPEGAELDEVSGVLHWVPGAEQLGPFYVSYTVTDSGLPPETVEGMLVLKVSPEDSCVLLDCDPERGCEAAAKPLGESCCAETPPPRVAEPVSGCPGGRVVFVGRNVQGFGRMQNCDQLRVIPFAQGGLNVRLHVETRCMNADFPISVLAQLETLDRVVFEGSRELPFRLGEDGYAQRLDIVFAADSGDFFDLEGQEALLYVELRDVDGEIAETTLRLGLTLSRLDDLPDPGD